MPSQAFLHRMDAVLASRVRQEKARTRSRLAPVWGALGIVGVTLACVIVLKAAALAQGNVLGPRPVAEAGIGAQIGFWLTGADPISSALATVLRPRAEVQAVDVAPAAPVL